QSGQKRSKIRAVVENFQFLGTGSGTSGRSEGGSSRRYNSGPRDSQRASSEPPADSFDEDFGSGDDIPF
ncbi:MAG: single-stranded DNA-binding protein, partial [Planctomycetes bacterium]|nr:single-stranded DNA-binding protein [Planctomycetota bacterium]